MGWRRNVDLVIGLHVLAALALGVVAADDRYGRTRWLLAGMLVAGSALLVILRRRRRARRTALGAALDEVARGLVDARFEGGSAVTVAWLDAHWANESSPHDLHFGSIGRSIGGVMRGHPVLVDVQPDGVSGEDESPPRVLIYVASPGITRAPATGPAAALVRGLEGVGFEIEILPGAGVRARASRRLVARFRKDAPGLARLTPILVELAVAVGDATAPASIPDPSPAVAAFAAYDSGSSPPK